MSKMAALSAMAGKAGGGMAAKMGAARAGMGAKMGAASTAMQGTAAYQGAALIPPLKKLVSPSTMVKLV